jgi:hypothetical protein
MGPPNRRRSTDSSDDSASSIKKQDHQSQSEEKKKPAFGSLFKKKGGNGNDNNSDSNGNSGKGSSSSNNSRGTQVSSKLGGPAAGAGAATGTTTPYDAPPPKYVPPLAATAPKADQVPPSGYRIALSTVEPGFPSIERTRPAPFVDTDGCSPVFIGSALLQYSVHPCKIAPRLASPSVCRVPYGGSEYEHQGRYDLLPFVPEQMEFIPTSYGRIPPGRRPVKGGFESNGAELYHAVAVIDGVKVPGKTGIHLVRSHTLLFPRPHLCSGILPICRTRIWTHVLIRAAVTSRMGTRNIL